MSIFAQKAPYHILIYSALFGASTFHSFVSAPTEFKTLSRSDFGKIQAKIFPNYFLAQSVGPLLLYLTSPTPVSFATRNVFGLVSLCGLVNYFWLLGWCQRLKHKREMTTDEEELKKISKEFGMAHGLSTVVNLIGIIGLGSYSFVLGKLLL